MAKIKQGKSFEKIEGSKSLQELIDTAKTIPPKERTKEIVKAIYDKTEEFMPKRK